VLLALTRQDVPTLARPPEAGAGLLAKGAYVLADAQGGAPELILLASGSEVGLIVRAAARLQAEGIRVRCVSMPSWDLFERQDQAYRDAVLPPAVAARLSVEAGSVMGWKRWVGDAGDSIGIDHYGASAPAKTLLKEFGFTVENVVGRARALLGR